MDSRLSLLVAVAKFGILKGTGADHVGHHVPGVL
jgi:hypothetical protein